VQRGHALVGDDEDAARVKRLDEPGQLAEDAAPDAPHDHSVGRSTAM
jgi:hypothetical protein